MKSRIRAKFILTGNRIEMMQLTKAIGIKPTRIWKKGDPIVPTLLKRRQDAWMVETRYSRTIDAPKVVKRLLTKLRPATRQIRNACARFGLKCQLAVDVYHSQQDSYPILWFEPQTLDHLAQLGAGMDIDIIGTL